MNASPDNHEPLVRIRQAVKNYGHTRALTGVTLDIRSGEVIGIIGHNGAGKSTLMRLLSGLEACDSGSVSIGNREATGPSGFSGVRMAYQEGSLALELTVRDNIYLSGWRAIPGLRWRGAAAILANERLGQIFPANTISAEDYVSDLTLAERQMVEIARATITDDLRLLILDEPTESLSGTAVDHLYEYVRVLRNAGCAIILVSHRLKEILSVADRIAVMKDGKVVSVHQTRSVSERDLFNAMGGEAANLPSGEIESRVDEAPRSEASLRIPMQDVNGEKLDIVARKGEVIGLAGIAGQGQEQVLQRLWQGRRGDVDVSPKRAFVPGDRQRSGILPLWNVSRNLTISALSGLSSWGIRKADAEKSVVERWVKLIKIRGGGDAAITALSGGNQQKVIVARAFASGADTILLDDPFRGVDVHTKSELYRLIKSETANGRTIVWYSSENSEMRHCDRTYVLRAGRVAGELQGTAITDERIIAMSFAEKEAKPS